MAFQKKTAILCILRVLEEETDDSHYLNYTEIIDILKRDYGLEIERKAVARMIDDLIDMEYDIEKDGRNGVALLKRVLQPSEISYIVDALYSSRVISANDSKIITESISSLLSKYERKKYRTIYKSEDPKRNVNRDFFLNVDTINTAIDENKKISFNYVSYDERGNEIIGKDGYEYKINPYYLINNFGKYYILSCNDKRSNITHYRVDYMKNVKILDEERMPENKVSEIGYDFKIEEYIKNHIYMFGGKIVNAEILLKNVKGVRDAIDWFGKNISISNKENEIIGHVKCNEQALIYWALQYMDVCTVLKPIETRNRIYLEIRKSLNEYKELTKNDLSMPEIKLIIKSTIETLKDDINLKFTRKNLLSEIKRELENNSLDSIDIKLDNGYLKVTNGIDTNTIRLVTYSKNLKDMDYFYLLKDINSLDDNETLVIMSKGRLIDKKENSNLSKAFNKKNKVKAKDVFEYREDGFIVEKDLNISFRGFKRPNGVFYKYAVIGK